MEVSFRSNYGSCLREVLQELQNNEQTQEIRLSEGMPDVGQILAAWGQPVLRSKEWSADTVSFSGGMMVWVLYTPEDGSPEQCLEGWIPFQMRWDLPEDLPEGRLSLRLRPRSVDARSVSPRKVLVRAGMSAMAQAFVPTEIPLCLPEANLDGVELLRSTYPVRLMKEGGEKNITLEETLILPDSAPQPQSIVYYRMDPWETDRKVLSQKVVFRGNAGLHLLYRCQEGQLHSWDFEIPFSQFTELTGEYGPEAQVDFAFCPTGLDLELDEAGRLHLKCGITAQYLITDQEQLELVEDAYSPRKELSLLTQQLEIPAVLERRKETLLAEQGIPAEAAAVADSVFLADFPRQRHREGGIAWEQPGLFQSLYYGTDGALHTGTSRWEGRMELDAGENVRIRALPGFTQPQCAIGSGQLTMKAELPIEFTSDAVHEITAVTGLALGDDRKLDPSRPSLILRRAGDSTLWEIAKASNSTVDSIRQANSLQNEPAPGQMLLIPIL